MKQKLCWIFLILLPLLVLAGCEEKQSETEAVPDPVIEYGDSTIYSQEDMDAAIARIRAEFDTWEGCELHSIRYMGDENNNDENIQWTNELNEGKNYTQCIAFESDFHSPKNGGGAWTADVEYTNWQWWLARSDGGDWDLLTWGYG